VPGTGPATSEPAKPCAAVRVRRLGDSNSICAVTATSSPPSVEHRAASAMPTITLELTERADALALGNCRPQTTTRTGYPATLGRRAHHRRRCPSRTPAAIRRSARPVRLRSATLLPPGRHDRCRPHRQIGRRLPPRPTLTSL